MSFKASNSLTFWLGRLASTLQERFNDELSTLGISWSQWLLINCVSQGQADTPAAIAEHLGVNRSAVTRLLDRLQKKGLVERRANDGDRRSTRVSISASGQLLVKYMDDAAQRHQQHLQGQLTDEEYTALKILLGKLLQAEGVTTYDWR